MFQTHTNVRRFPIAILATPGGASLAQSVDERLRELCRENGEGAPTTFIRQTECPRFQNGEGKGIVKESVRGTDLYVLVDVGNYGVSYTRYGKPSPMTPDEHFTDLKRLLGAVKNMPQRTTVIMPLLYASRQHKMRGRESLDCAMALQELVNLGVDSIMTLDAHNSHVMNAIPRHGLENLHSTYQLIESFLQETRGQVNISPEELLVCSPDLGGLERARYFAEHFRVQISGFYKFRDLSRVVNGKNPTLEHKFLGGDVEGRTVLVVDDMLASGGTLLEVCDALRKRKAARIYLSVSYALFSDGLEIFDEAYRNGLFQRVFGTNGTYVPPELAKREWFVTVDVNPFIAKFIHTFNRDGSITRLLDSTERINKLLGRELPSRPAAPSRPPTPGT